MVDFILKLKLQRGSWGLVSSYNRFVHALNINLIMLTMWQESGLFVNSILG